MNFLRMIFSTRYNNNLLDIWLLILRITVGAFMLTHGIPKLQILLSGEEINFADPIGIGVKTSFILIIFAEFFCSILIILGAFTRLAAIPLMFSMIVASFVAHSADPFAQKELSLLYLVLFLNFLVMGAGGYSLDYLISDKLLRKKR